MSAVADNLARLNELIGLAAVRVGRQADEITLIAVTKKQPVSVVAEALAAGVLEIGENYVQEAAEKRAALHDGHWHLLGHLQSNKAKLAVSLFDLIQSVDSAKLARVIGRHAQEAGKVQEILLQVHLGEEATKTGIAPESALDAGSEIAAIPGVNLRGLMGIAPFGTNPRPDFQLLRKLFDSLPVPSRQILSMGMSSDFETAIEEGTTMVRVGTAIFGIRSEKTIYEQSV